MERDRQFRDPSGRQAMRGFRSSAPGSFAAGVTMALTLIESTPKPGGGL